MSLKKCNKCKDEKSFSSFNKRAKSKDGLNHICKLCISKRRKELRTELKLKVKTAIRKTVLIENRFEKLDDNIAFKNKMIAKEKQSKENYIKQNKEKVLESKRKWRENNKDKEKAYRDSIKEDRKEYDRLRYLERKARRWQKNSKKTIK